MLATVRVQSPTLENCCSCIYQNSLIEQIKLRALFNRLASARSSKRIEPGSACNWKGGGVACSDLNVDQQPGSSFGARRFSKN